MIKILRFSKAIDMYSMSNFVFVWAIMEVGVLKFCY